MALETLVAPAIEPVTLAQARAFLRIGTDGDDNVLTSLIVAAREALEARTGRALITRTQRQSFLVPSRSNLPGTLLPGRVPATTILAARVITSSGTEVALPLGSLALIGGRFKLLAALPVGALGLVVDYQTGCGLTPDDVPEAFKISILEAVADALIRRDAGTVAQSPSWAAPIHEVKL